MQNRPWNANDHIILEVVSTTETSIRQLLNHLGDRGAAQAEEVFRSQVVTDEQQTAEWLDVHLLVQLNIRKQFFVQVEYCAIDLFDNLTPSI